MQDYLRLQGKTVQQYHDELHEPAERRLQGQLVLAELATAEEIAVSEEEKLAELERLVGQRPNPEEAASFREVFGSESGLRFIEADLRSDKTLARLRAIVTGQAEAAPVEAREVRLRRRCRLSLPSRPRPKQSKPDCGMRSE